MKTLINNTVCALTMCGAILMIGAFVLYFVNHPEVLQTLAK